MEFLNSTVLGIKTETDESIKDDFNTLLNNTENKNNERLDFSYIYQQFNHFIYVLGIYYQKYILSIFLKIGGFFDNPSNVIERFDLQKNEWEEIDNFPQNRAKFGAASLNNGNIILIGGKQVNKFIIKLMLK